MAGAHGPQPPLGQPEPAPPVQPYGQPEPLPPTYGPPMPQGYPQAAPYGAYAPPPRVRRLWGWPFGAWIAVGIGLGILLPVALFFAANAIDSAVHGYSTGSALGYALFAYVAVAVGGILRMVWSQTRGLGAGLLISVAAAPIVVFGVCVAMMSAGGY